MTKPHCPRCKSAIVARRVLTVVHRGRMRRVTLRNRFVCANCGHRWNETERLN
jgi:transposase-like protein